MPRRLLHAVGFALALTSFACADPPEGPQTSVLDQPDTGAPVTERTPGAFARPCASAGKVSGGGTRARLCLSPSHASSGTASGNGVRLIASPPRHTGPATSPR